MDSPAAHVLLLAVHCGKTQGREAGRGSERDASPVFPDETRYFYGRSGVFHGRKLVFFTDENWFF
jgi:hypothetical protein